MNITPAQQAFLGLSDDTVERTRRVSGESADQRRTRLRRELLARGIHPLTRTRLRPEGGTCGDCAHLRPETIRSGRTFYKCALVGSTNGPGTDLRISWPACVRYEATA